MGITYRKLEEKDLERFISMRIAQLREEGATEDLDLVPPLMDYYRRHMADGTFVSWLAVNGDRIIGTSGMSFVEKPPYFSCPSGRIGLPVLATSICNAPPVSRTVTEISPPPAGAMPCSTAFSSTGCSVSSGTRQSISFSSVSIRRLRRSPKRSRTKQI